MYIRDIILNKRSGRKLILDEIEFVIQGYFREEISNAQMAALMTAIRINGMSEQEVSYFVNAMAETGDELEFYRISNKITDIHSLGGISDKIILILISVIDSLGFPAAKVLGRELGLEDRLNSIPGYKIEDNIENFKESIYQNNIGILKNMDNLAPIENKLYRLRHEIACDNDMGLIATSIMSQKIALGFYNIFFEITYGPNAYVKTLSDAKILARYLTSIGKQQNRKVGCAVTPLNEPVGKTFGNLLELREIYKFLNGENDKEIEEVVLNFGCNICYISGLCTDYVKAKRMIKQSIQNKNALKSFEKLITINGGEFEVLKNDVVPKNEIPILSTEEGYISEIDVNQLRQIAQYLDAIRISKLDRLDYGAGIVFNKKVGDQVSKGQIIAYLYTNNDTKIKEASQMAKNMIKIQPKKPKSLNRVEFNLN